MTALYARFFHLTSLPEQGVRVVTLWPEGSTAATHTVSRMVDGGEDVPLLEKECVPFDNVDLAGRHWAICENIRLGYLVTGDGPEAAVASGEEEHHGAA